MCFYHYMGGGGGARPDGPYTGSAHGIHTYVRTIKVHTYINTYIHAYIHADRRIDIHVHV